MNLFSYFRNQQIDRILFLLQPPEKVPLRGCIYGFIKLFFSLMAMSLPLHMLADIMHGLGPSPSISGNDWANGILTLLFLPLIILAPVFAIDMLEKIWRKRLYKNSGKKPLDLEKILGAYRQSTLKNAYNKQEIDYIFKRISPEIPLKDNLQTLSARQLILIEDALLFIYESNLVANPFPYGTRILNFALVVLFILGFGTAYNIIEPWIRDIFGPNRSGMVMLFLLMPIAIYVMARAMRDVAGLWERLGATLRFIIRLLLYYWPVTLLLIILVNYGVKEWIAV